MHSSRSRKWIVFGLGDGINAEDRLDICKDDLVWQGAANQRPEKREGVAKGGAFLCQVYIDE